ncbi:glycoside hydrolase family 16 protein [Neolentinus lepideus HHB14362 ss-1]|uniref:Glycoside hydrolase family 16 protein n=1 Tax=Neolentinus lepideus HHB14362 ss-1 TaxID=1314782 RepID=A0A165VYU3_9AGAM|nr:glycoside hydrolase family 16 protein [Neolentinus lepideus HHB14362 ss-1]
MEWQSSGRRGSSASGSSSFEYDKNGSSFLWVIQDTYEGQSFFDRFGFYSDSDPTHGTVTYVNASTAFSSGLAYVTNDNKVIMKGDNSTWLPEGTDRSRSVPAVHIVGSNVFILINCSVRVSSYAQYNTGLFILDVDRAPWGCGVWPAFWTVGSGQWPYTGEIDIVEGVHDNQHNQVTWHTGENCTLTPTANFTGTIVQTNGQDNLNCYGNTNDNAGCGITEWSRASYGPTFDAQGGGVFAMKWDDEGIAVWSFYRAAVPADVVDGQPNPSGWPEPDAALDPAGCDPIANFVNHSIVFDITFCGDWAGNSYTTSGCPGTCAERLMDPSNFVNASWIINTLKVYKKQIISGEVSGANPQSHSASLPIIWALTSLLIFLGLAL